MSASSPDDGFPIEGAPFPFLREFIDANGGQASFEGLITGDVVWVCVSEGRSEHCKKGQQYQKQGLEPNQLLR